MMTLQSNASLKIKILRLLSKNRLRQKEIVTELGYGKEFRAVYNALEVLLGYRMITTSYVIDPLLKPMYEITSVGLDAVLEHLEPTDFWPMISFNLYGEKKNKIPITKKLFDDYESAKEMYWSEYLKSPFQDTRVKPYKEEKFLPYEIRNNEKIFLELLATEKPQTRRSVINRFQNIPEIRVLKTSLELGNNFFDSFMSQLLIKSFSDDNQKKFRLGLRGLLLEFHYLADEFDNEKLDKRKQNSVLFHYHDLLPEIFTSPNIADLGISDTDIIKLFDKIYFNRDQLVLPELPTSFSIFSDLRTLKENESSKKFDDFLTAFTKESKRFPQIMKEKEFERNIKNYYKIHFDTSSARNTFALHRKILFDFFLAYREIHPSKWTKVRDKIPLDKSTIGNWHDKCIRELVSFSKKKQEMLLKTLKN